MIDLDQFMTGIAMGAILIIMGLVPGLPEKWADALSDLAEKLVFRFPITSRDNTRTPAAQQLWLAALGMVVISLSRFLYTAR
jgi:hypothetical protein